jgi:SAM-dependent methyltransferase
VEPKDSYVEWFQSDDIVKHYVGVYSSGTFDAHINSLQATWLRAFVGHQWPGVAFQHLDFACGTGRIVQALVDLADSSAGFDTSPGMLAVAEKEIPGASWHVVAPDAAGWDIPATSGPRLVTAFRFLLNADPDLQHKAFEFAAAALPRADSGLLIINNHGHNRSALRLSRKQVDETGIANNRMTDAAVLSLAADHGFALQRRAGFALVTRRLYRSRVLAPPTRLVNRVTAGSRPLAAIASDVAYVFRRT